MKRFVTLNSLQGDFRFLVEAIEMLGYKKDSGTITVLLNGIEHQFVFASRGLAEEAFKKLSYALEPNSTLDEQKTDTNTDTDTDTDTQDEKVERLDYYTVYDTMPFIASSTLDDVTWYAFYSDLSNILKTMKIRHHTYVGKVVGADGQIYHGWRRDK